MEKLNKTKLVIIIILVLVVIAAIILGVIFLNKSQENPSSSSTGTISNTESEFEPLTIKDIEVRYVEERNETVLDFVIENLTDEKVENQEINIHLLDENDTLTSGLTTTITTLDAKGNQPINITLGGNIQGIRKIKLVKPQQEEVPTE